MLSRPSMALSATILSSLSLICSPPLLAQQPTQDDITQLKQQIAQLQQQLQQLEQRLQQSAQHTETHTNTAAKQNSTSKNDHSSGISVGGAIRSNFSHTSYDAGNKNRGGDFDFDIFRLNLNGTIGEVLLNAELRIFDYMTVVKSAYVGYQFSDNWQAQAGITQVPFGNWPYNSHNYFFSANYYLGLEDDYDLGVMLRRRLTDNWQLDVGFFKNDELGGVDGYVDSRADRYSYDIVGSRWPGDGIYDAPAQALAEYNTFAGRFAYHVQHYNALSTEMGISALAGGLHDGQQRAGDYNAWALHLNSQYQRWNLQLQYSRYQYDIDHVNRIAVGAYAFYDSIAAEASSATANIAYSLPVQWGPVTGLQFYNDFSLVYDKSDHSANTMMNVTGFSVSAGGLFTYIDLVHARNQPFVGGSMAADSSETERRFNINLGYYF